MLHVYREQVSNANASPEAIVDNAMQVATTGNGELDVATMKKYVQYQIRDSSFEFYTFPAKINFDNSSSLSYPQRVTCRKLNFYGED